MWMPEINTTLFNFNFGLVCACVCVPCISLSFGILIGSLNCDFVHVCGCVRFTCDVWTASCAHVYVCNPCVICTHSCTMHARVGNAHPNRPNRPTSEDDIRNIGQSAMGRIKTRLADDPADLTTSGVIGARGSSNVWGHRASVRAWRTVPRVAVERCAVHGRRWRQPLRSGETAGVRGEFGRVRTRAWVRREGSPRGFASTFTRNASAQG